MIIADLFGWWYSRGFVWAANKLFIESSKNISRFFSISDLLKTLFAPFRQDTVNVQGAPLGVKLQAMGINAIARVFGFLIRSTLIFVGLIVLLMNLVLAVLGLIMWPILPVSPAVAILLMFLKVGI